MPSANKSLSDAQPDARWCFIQSIPGLLKLLFAYEAAWDLEKCRLRFSSSGVETPTPDSAFLMSFQVWPTAHRLSSKAQRPLDVPIAHFTGQKVRGKDLQEAGCKPRSL